MKSSVLHVLKWRYEFSGAQLIQRIRYCKPIINLRIRICIFHSDWDHTFQLSLLCCFWYQTHGAFKTIERTIVSRLGHGRQQILSMTGDPSQGKWLYIRMKYSSRTSTPVL